jgi:hypothetical protein
MDGIGATPPRAVGLGAGASAPQPKILAAIKIGITTRMNFTNQILALIP